jgi:hypothetical protein
VKPTVNNIERWLSDVETRLVPPERPPLGLSLPPVYQARDKEKALARLAALYPDRFAGLTVEDINWSDDLEAIQAKALAEHIAAHPEDVGRPLGRSIVYVIVLEPQEVELPAEEAEVEDRKIEDDIVVSADASDEVSETPPQHFVAGSNDEGAAVSETQTTPAAPNVVRFEAPWRPVHQRPARDMRRPTWKKWER